jgi:glutamine synthetase
MAAVPADVLKTIKEKDVKFVDLRFTDTRGKEQHVQVPSRQFTQDKFDNGHAFDGSSIAGWKGIEASDMLLMPDPDSARIDPFTDETTLNITCDVVEPSDGKGYDRDPRSLAKRAEAYLKSTGLGDTAYFGPEPEFFIFDSVTWHSDMSGWRQDRIGRSAWSTGREYEGSSIVAPYGEGRLLPVPHRPATGHPQRHFASAGRAGRRSGGVHHEVSTAGQNEIGTSSAPWSAPTGGEILKHDLDGSHHPGKPATFMPKPTSAQRFSCTCTSRYGRAGKCRQRLCRPVRIALFYIGGVIKHAKALNAITNPGTNSYKRLVPGFEAPINLAYSAKNRSAACRIPHVSNPKGRRVEVRFPDPTANPYLAFAAMLMAGLDGVQNKIHPGDPIDKNLYDLPPEVAAKIPHPCASLDEALEHIDKDREFLTRGGVFSNDMLDGYIALKMDEVTRFRMTTHPIEFDMYYSL